MDFYSTRDDSERATVSEAISAGLAPDGGLYVPESLPAIDPTSFAEDDPIERIAQRALAPFFEGDELEGELEEICRATYDFPIPVTRVGESLRVLELFHGPTAAFKDVGARFLAECLSRLNEGADDPLTILVATSGDTGAAVSAAFEGLPNVEVVCLYPTGRVSDRQEALLTCWGDNVRTYGVEGDFDDCQKIVKEAFADEWWRQNRRLSSANSINIGRLLPQMTYYAMASLRLRVETDDPPQVIVPTGNGGNVLAALYARQMGFPIGDIIMATNENRPITHYLQTGDWQTYQTEQTLASAMDVGNPSNFERILHMWPDVEQLREQVSAVTVTDEEIEETIQAGPDRWGQVWDPHTACAVRVREQSDAPLAMVVATAHPAKFPDVVEPLVGREIPIPPRMRQLLKRPRSVTAIEPTLDALRDAEMGRRDG
jgi:threonine synthase